MHEAPSTTWDGGPKSTPSHAQPHFKSSWGSNHSRTLHLLSLAGREGLTRALHMLSPGAENPHFLAKPT